MRIASRATPLNCTEFYELHLARALRPRARDARAARAPTAHVGPYGNGARRMYHEVDARYEPSSSWQRRLYQRKRATFYTRTQPVHPDQYDMYSRIPSHAMSFPTVKYGATCCAVRLNSTTEASAPSADDKARASITMPACCGAPPFPFTSQRLRVRSCTNGARCCQAITPRPFTARSRRIKSAPREQQHLRSEAHPLPDPFRGEQDMTTTNTARAMRR